MSINLKELNNQLTIPEESKASSIKVNEAAFIFDFLKEKGIKKTLEIGFSFGRSTAHIISATESNHTVIDPFQHNYDNLGVKNMQHLNLDQFLTFENDYSHNVLPKLHAEKENFEFIFIDGDHKYDGIFIDFYYSDLLLSQGGYMLFHDTWMRSTQLVCSFVKTNRKDYQLVKTPIRNLMLFKKIGSDDRSWMFFKEFYTFKSIMTHKLIAWMTSGKSNAFKKAVLKLKEIYINKSKV